MKKDRVLGARLAGGLLADAEASAAEDGEPFPVYLTAALTAHLATERHLPATYLLMAELESDLRAGARTARVTRPVRVTSALMDQIAATAVAERCTQTDVVSAALLRRCVGGGPEIVARLERTVAAAVTTVGASPARAVPVATRAVSAPVAPGPAARAAPSAKPVSVGHLPSGGELLALRQSGMSNPQIAARYGTSKTSVQNRIAKHVAEGTSGAA